MILRPLQKLPNNVGDLGKIIVATKFECLPKKQKTPNLVTLVLDSNAVYLLFSRLVWSRVDGCRFETRD